MNWLVNDELCSDTTFNKLKTVNPMTNIVVSVDYLALPYDTGYFTNDQDTFQTIRFRNTWGTDGTITNNESLYIIFQVPNPICSPLVIRSSTGELHLAISMSYTGPVKQWKSIGKGYTRKVGLSSDDVENSNTLLAKMFGDGTDKTAEDFLNIQGGIVSSSDVVDSVTSLNSVLQSDKVEQINSVNTAVGSIEINASRSKASSNVETPVINTVTKW